MQTHTKCAYFHGKDAETDSFNYNKLYLFVLMFIILLSMREIVNHNFKGKKKFLENL